MKYSLVCFLILIAFSANTFSQSTHRSEIGIHVDNDSFLFNYSDRYYTNGTFIYFRHALDASSNNLLENKVLGIEIGQKLFNAQSGYVADQRYIDRPFAAYLYAGANVNLLYKNESNVKLSAQIGLVGPAAQGEAVQNFIHNTFGFYQLNGWQYQVGNDVELNLSAEYNKLIARASLIDATLSTYLNVGNGLTGAGIGPLIRFGNFNQLFRSVSTQSTAIKGNSSTALHKNELFFYYKPQINLVIYDATVQGSVFKKYDPNSSAITLDPTPVVFSQQFGVAYASKRIIVDIGVISHSTRDVKEMVKSDQWGCISLFYRFN